MGDFQRPPHGIMPKNIWLWDRANELSATIQRYIQYGGFANNDKLEKIKKWIEELDEVIGQMIIEKQKNENILCKFTRMNREKELN